MGEGSVRLLWFVGLGVREGVIWEERWVFYSLCFVNGVRKMGFYFFEVVWGEKVMGGWFE